MFNLFKKKKSLGFGLIGILLMIGVISVTAMGGMVYIQNQTNRGNVVKFLNMEPVSAGFYGHKPEYLGELLGEMVFSLEYSNQYYGTEIKRERVNTRRNRINYLKFSYILPNELKNNLDFKNKFLDNFTKLKKEFNKSLSEVNWNNVYILQLEIDKDMVEAMSRVSAFKSVTPESLPKYEFTLRNPDKYH